MSPRIESPPYEDRLRLANPLNDGELAVWEALRDGLDDAWEIYVQPYVGDAHPDVVLLHPAVGVVALEVKHVDLETRSPRHLEAEVRVAEAQARRYRKALSSCLKTARKPAALEVRACVVYTRTATEVADAVQPSRLTSQVPVLVLDDVVPAIAALRPSRADGADEKALMALRHWLVEPEFVREQRDVPPVARLTAKQREIVLNPDDVARRRVKGGAGSGKTLALAARAAVLSTQPGTQVLVVCFNRTLVTYLSDMIAAYVRQVGGDRKAIVVYHWDGWWSGVFDRLGSEDQERARFDAGPERAQAAREILEDGGDRGLPSYDAVLVDEAQDLTPDHLRALRFALEDPERGELLALFDGAQDIYGMTDQWGRGSFTALGFSGKFSQLQENQRMPPRLAVIANRFAQRFMDVHEENLLAVAAAETLEERAAELRWVQCGAADVVDAAIAAIDAMFDTAAARERDVVAWADLIVAARRRDTAQQIAARLRGGGRKAICAFAGTENSPEDRLAKSTFYKGDGRIKVSTIKSLKGFETTATVIVVEPFGHASDAAYREVYTALTRLKARDGGSSLTVVCAESTLAEFGEGFANER